MDGQNGVKGSAARKREGQGGDEGTNGAASGRELKVDNSDGLHDEVVGEVVDDEAEEEGLDDGEGREDDPVGWW